MVDGCERTVISCTQHLFYVLFAARWALLLTIFQDQKVHARHNI